MKERRMSVGLCAVLLSLVCFAFGGEAQAGETALDVHANKIRNDTKLFVQAGDVVSIQASGQWTVRPKEGVYCGPEGEPGTSAPAGYQLPGAPIGALVAIVMGKAYRVGSSAEITFEKSGPLLLMANDRTKLSAYLENKGTLTVRLEVRKGGAAAVSGRYRIAFKDDEVLIVSGNEKKVVSLGDLEKQKVRSQTGKQIELPADTAEKLKTLPGEIELEVEKVQVFLRDPQKPQEPPLKGLYDPNKKQFAIHVEGTVKQVVGACYFTYAKTVAGKFVSGNLDGSVNLTLSLFCAGGEKGKGKAVIVSIPFEGTQVQ